MHKQSQANHKSYGRGETLFREGDKANCAYLILSGSVEIFLPVGDQECLLATIGPGQVFGEMGLIDGAPRCASARARNTLTLKEITQEDIDQLRDGADAGMWALMEALIRRLRTTNQQVKRGMQDKAA